LEDCFIVGSSPGGLLLDAEIFGNLDANRNEEFVEAVNCLLRIWKNELGIIGITLWRMGMQIEF
jgi:hypothetical protein